MVSQIDRSELTSQLIKSKENDSEKKWCAGSCLLSPASLLLEFKRLYRRRYLDAKVFNGNPLQTIEEAAETPPLLEENDRSLDINNDSCNNENYHNSRSDSELVEQQERGAFCSEYSSSEEDFSSDDDDDYDDENESEDTSYSDRDFNNSTQLSNRPLTDSCIFSPSVSLINQFEASVKNEAARRIQRWYRTLIQRRNFLAKKSATITIQRWYKSTLGPSSSSVR